MTDTQRPTEQDPNDIHVLRARIDPKLIELLLAFEKASNIQYWTDDQGTPEDADYLEEHACAAEVALLKYIQPKFGLIL